MQNRIPGQTVEVQHGMTLTLARERFGIHWLVDHVLHDVRGNMREEEHYDACKAAMVKSLETSILTLDGDYFDISYPRDWWNHTKKRWFPKWALSRWPVELTCHHERRYGKVFLSVFPDRTTQYQGDRMNFAHFDDQLVG
jgi:hypothetical protein